MTMMRQRSGRPQGFTLIELIVVIAITAVIGGMVAIFIKSSVDNYFAAERRAELTDAADSVLRRLARDIRLALPNSVRVTDSAGNAGTCANGTCYIEFIPTTGGGRYRAAGDGSTAGSILDFNNTAAISFDVLGPMPSLPAAGNFFVVVYNLGPDFPPANAYLRGAAYCDSTPSAGGCNIAVGTAGAGSITLDANPFAYESPPLPSPNDRFQVVPGTGPVTYSCALAGGSAAAMTRYTGYGFSTAQPHSAAALAGGTAARALSNATCEVDYAPTVMARAGLLFVRIYVTDATTNESVQLFREIHVDNSP